MAAAPAAAQLRLDVYVSGLTSPVGFVQDPSTPSLQYVIEQGGTIRVIQHGMLLAAPFLNIAGSISAGGERGLLGLAFAPDYATSRRFFVYFTNPDGNPVVARFKRQEGNPLLADPASRFDLRWGGPSGQRFISHPFANHNGGHLAFGPDHYLYIASGDGGSANDPQNHAQNPNSLLGKLLRIDVNVPDADTEGYVVPPDNPFTDGVPIAALPEIWAFGLRNPWKFSFDSQTGGMFIGDVGQNNWEEIDYQPPGVGGRNYGWRIREGLHATPGVPATSPAYLPLVDPIFEYSHTVGSSITGGFVYRGVAIHESYRGRYFFADFVTGKLFSIGITTQPDSEVVAMGLVEHTAEIGSSSVTGMVSAFGQDAFGEIYVVSYSRGMVLKLGGPAPTPPPLLRADFNRDGLPDLLWFNDSTRALAVWSMSGHNGATAVRGVFLDAPQVPDGWRVLGAADVDRDGHTDMFVQSNSGQLGVWLFDGTTFRYGAWLNPSTAADPNWRVRAFGDFNRDGFTDVVWQYEPTGLVAFWLLNGVAVVADSVVSIVPGPDWEVVGTGDADGDGETDLYWQHRVTGTLALWHMSGTDYTDALLLSASPADSNWRVVATSDLNLDGLIDLIFQHAVTGGLGAWYLDDETVLFGGSLTPWHVGDMNWRLIGPR